MRNVAKRIIRSNLVDVVLFGVAKVSSDWLRIVNVRNVIGDGEEYIMDSQQLVPRVGFVFLTVITYHAIFGLFLFPNV